MHVIDNCQSKKENVAPANNSAFLCLNSSVSALTPSASSFFFSSSYKNENHQFKVCSNLCLIFYCDFIVPAFSYAAIILDAQMGVAGFSSAIFPSSTSPSNSTSWFMESAMGRSEELLKNDLSGSVIQHWRSHLGEVSHKCYI